MAALLAATVRALAPGGGGGGGRSSADDGLLADGAAPRCSVASGRWHAGSACNGSSCCGGAPNVVPLAEAVLAYEIEEVRA